MPTSIVKRAGVLLEQARRKERLQKQQKQLTDYQSRERDFREHAERLHRLMQTYRLFEEHDVGFERTPGAVGETLRLLHEVRRNFQEDPSYVIDRRNSLSSLWRKIAAHCKGLQLRLEKGWRQYVKSRAPGQDEEVLNVLERIPDFEKPVRRIRNHMSSLDQKKQELPQTKEGLDVIQRLSEAVEEAWQSIGSGELSEDVLTFLRKAASRTGAPLDLLTPGVRDWLEREGLTKSFAVRVGR